MSVYVRDVINRKYKSEQKGLLWVWGINGMFIVLQLDQKTQLRVGDEEKAILDKMEVNLHQMIMADRLEEADGDSAPLSPSDSEV